MMPGVFVGAKKVTLLDREPKALQCALLTAAASGLKTTTSAAAFSESETEAKELEHFTKRLQASATADSSTAHGQGGTLGACLFDWNDDFSGVTYDTVIACDVLYENVAVEPLARLLPMMLAGAEQDSRILLTDPEHRTPDHRRRFREWPLLCPFLLSWPWCFIDSWLAYAVDLLVNHDPSLAVDFVKTVSVQHSLACGGAAPVKVLSHNSLVVCRQNTGHYASTVALVCRSLHCEDGWQLTQSVFHSQAFNSIS